MAKSVTVSEELQKRLQKLDVDASRNALARAEREWKRQLVLGDDNAVSIAESEFKRAQADLARVESAFEALKAAIAEAQAAEKNKELDARHAALTVEAEALKKALSTDYLKCARIISELMHRLTQFEINRMYLHAHMSSMGRNEPIPHPEQETLGKDDRHWVEMASLPKVIRLPYI